ncbi:MAG: stage III sporulation protein AE [Lachnospiraceae bacterium]|nr:stage III sporulation protein AE [Lachnospiraceae bacterium]
MKKIILGVIILVFMWIPNRVYASEMGDEEIEIDFSEWEEVIEESGISEANIDIEELFSLLAQGKTKEVGKKLIESVKNILFGEIGKQKEILVSLFFLLLIAGIFSTLTQSFQNGLTSQTGFYVTYLLLFSLSFSAFYTSCQVVLETLGQILGFMKVVIPVYCLFVAMSSGQAVGSGMYELLFLVLYGLEWLMKNIIFPAIKIYVVFSMLKELSEELKLERLCNMLKNAIQWILKAVTVFVLGLSTVQNMILPTVDGVKYLAIQKSIKALPAGEAALAAGNFITGSSIVIKNSVGITAMILLLLLLIVPFVKIGIMLVGFMGLGALMEPICQKGFIHVLESVATGGILLWKMITTVALIFLVSICMITFATNMRLYGF